MARVSIHKQGDMNLKPSNYTLLGNCGISKALTILST
jgi:hypothetical protein